MINRFLSCSLLAVLAAVPGAAATAANQVAGSRPNVVFMLADDMGWAQPGFNGGSKELTPNMDRLAADGLRLTQFYAHSV